MRLMCVAKVCHKNATSLTPDGNIGRMSRIRRMDRMSRMSGRGGPSWASRVKATGVALGGLLMLLGAPGAAAADRAKTLNLYAWAEYFPQALIERNERG